jgi:hypothetical protein
LNPQSCGEPWPAPDCGPLARLLKQACCSSALNPRSLQLHRAHSAVPSSQPQLCCVFPPFTSIGSRLLRFLFFLCTSTDSGVLPSWRLLAGAPPTFLRFPPFFALIQESLPFEASSGGISGAARPVGSYGRRSQRCSRRSSSTTVATEDPASGGTPNIGDKASGSQVGGALQVCRAGRLPGWHGSLFIWHPASRGKNPQTRCQHSSNPGPQRLWFSTCVLIGYLKTLGSLRLQAQGHLGQHAARGSPALLSVQGLQSRSSSPSGSLATPVPGGSTSGEGRTVAANRRSFATQQGMEAYFSDWEIKPEGGVPVGAKEFPASALDAKVETPRCAGLLPTARLKEASHLHLLLAHAHAGTCPSMS